MEQIKANMAPLINFIAYNIAVKRDLDWQKNIESAIKMKIQNL